MFSSFIFVLTVFLSLSPVYADFSIADAQHRVLIRLLQPLPSWIDLTEDLDSKGNANEKTEEHLSLSPDLIQGKEYFIERLRDENGFIKEVVLKKSSGEIEGSVYFTRNGSTLRSITVFNKQNQIEVNHSLQYDGYGRILSHILESRSNATPIESSLKYGANENLTIIESTGKTVDFVKTLDKVNLTVVKTNDGFAIRSIWKENNDGEIIWEAFDDGASCDPECFDGVSQRTWKKRQKTEKETIQEEGYVDLSSLQEVLVRRWITSYQNDEPVVIAYGRSGERILELRGRDFRSLPDRTTTPLMQKSFDSLGRIDSFLNNSSSEELSYDVFGRPEKVVSSDGAEAQMTFSPQGLIEHIQRPDGSSTDFEYNIDGLPSTIIQDNEPIAACQYDHLGRVTQTTKKMPSGTQEQVHFTYTSLHRREASSLNKTVLWSYDQFGRMTTIHEETIAGIQEWKIEYDDLDRVVKVEKEGIARSRTEYLYDLQGRKRKETFSEGDKSVEILWRWKADRSCLLTIRSLDTSYQYQLDSIGRIQTAIAYTSQGKQEVFYEYQDLAIGYKQIAKSSQGTTRERIYSNSHEVLSERTFNASNILTSELFWSDQDTHGSSSITERSYKDGSLIGSRKIHWRFGPSKRLESIEMGAETGPLRKTVYQYDQQGRLSTKILPDHISISYEYDQASRVKTIISSDKTIHYLLGYDREGRIIHAQDCITGQTVTRSFDSNGFLLEDSQGIATVRATCASPNQLSSLILPDNAAIIFQEDFIECQIDGKTLLREKAPRDTISKKQSNELFANPFLEPLLMPQKWKEDSLNVEYEFDSYGQLSVEKQNGNEVEAQRFCALGFLHERNGLSAIRNNEGRPIQCGDEKYSYDARGNLRKILKGDITYTLTHDAFDRLIEIKSSTGSVERYHFDAFCRKRTIEKASPSGHTIQELLWYGFEELGSMCNQKLYDLKIATYNSQTIPKTYGVFTQNTLYTTKSNGQGSITSYHIPGTDVEQSEITYSSFGTSLSTSPLPWGYMGKRKVEGIDGWDFGARLYLPYLRAWTSIDQLGLSQGRNPYAFLHNCPVGKVELYGLMGWPVDFNNLTRHVWKAAETVFWKSIESITFAKQKLDWFYEFRSHFEDLAYRLVSKSYLKVIGYNPDCTHAGTYGSRELTPKVRITQINGILNNVDDITGHADAISELHGGVPVHYIYSASSGFSGDIVQTFTAKLGIITQQTKLLVETWKRLIGELGGPDNGGLIIHYAHSAGGTATQVALSQMTRAERKIIRVVTFGSPTLVADHHCKSVMNYISLRDGVPILSGLEYWRAFRGHREDVCFLESTSFLPLIDHLLGGATYRRTLEDLGREFQEEYLGKPKRQPLAMSNPEGQL